MAFRAVTRPKFCKKVANNIKDELDETVRNPDGTLLSEQQKVDLVRLVGIGQFEQVF